MSSMNDKINKVRKPRIHIKYDVETEGGAVQKELPFVVGVMGDFSGNNTDQKKPALPDRKFINIDPDNFDDVMKKVNPGLSIRVENTLTDKDEELAVNLMFKSMEDFEPANIVKQVPALNELKQVRDKLSDLLSKTDRSDKLEQLLEDILKDNSKLHLLAAELGIAKDKGQEK
jgi:type VI secretion system protein ImpB